MTVLVRMKLLKLIPLILLITLGATQAYVDLSLSYTFSRNVIEGEEDPTDPDADVGKAISSTEGYSAVWAWYIWEYTAMELSYSQSTNRVEDDRETATDDETIIVTSVDSTVKTTVSGMGIRQSFADRKSRIIPSISIGYAEFVTSGSTVYTIDNNGTEETLTIEKETQKQSSSYATLQIRIRLTELMGLSLAAKTVMPEFDTSKAQNNVTYSAGFSWIF